MKRWQINLYMVGLFLIEAIIMLYAVPKANADEINMKISLVIALFLAILVSLALLVKGNQGNYKAIIPIFIVWLHIFKFCIVQPSIAGEPPSV